MKECEIDEEIQRLKNMKVFLSRQKEKILEYQKCVLNSPHLISLKTKALLMTPIPDDCPSKITHAIWKHLQQRNEKHLSDGTICATYRIEDFQNGRFDYYNAVYTELDDTNTMKDCYILPSGQYLQVYCRDEVNSIQRAYEQLQQYAKENNLRLGNTFYGDILLDELTSSQYHNYILKMMVAAEQPA